MESPAELRWPPSSRTPTPAQRTTTSSGTSPGPPTPTITAQVKYGGHQDVAGGRPLLRPTHPPPCASPGGVALQILERRGIHIAAHIRSIAQAEDRPFQPLGEPLEMLEGVKRAPFPVLEEQHAI